MVEVELSDTPEGRMLTFACPNCAGTIEVLECAINCCIFRHAIYKSNFQPINPHASQEIIQALKDNDLIEGCGTPFQIESKDGEYTVKICEYI